VGTARKAKGRETETTPRQANHRGDAWFLTTTARDVGAETPWTITGLSSAIAAACGSQVKSWMRLMKNGPSHADLVKAVRKLIEGDGGFIFKNWGGPMGTKGVSDLIGVHRGRAVAIECKAGKDKLTTEQRRFLERWRYAGGLGVEVRGIEEAADALDIGLLL
jgi:hypothetical protein